MLTSCLCTQRDFEKEEFRVWAERLKERFQYHRKLWEYCYIAQALYERGMLQPGRRGLGFAVGREPLVSLFASFGIEIVATDLDQQRAEQQGWVDSNQHAGSLEDLNERGICDEVEFRRRVLFRVVDMNHIPNDLQGFDFCWSSCALEHLGSIRLGAQFLERMTRCVRPGGVAVHTTEFNVNSNFRTIDHQTAYVLFRRRDIQRIERRLTAQGHCVESIDLNPGDGELDRRVCPPPFDTLPHLKIQLGKYVATSLGLITRIASSSSRE